MLCFENDIGGKALLKWAVHRTYLIFWWAAWWCLFVLYLPSTQDVAISVLKGVDVNKFPVNVRVGTLEVTVEDLSIGGKLTCGTDTKYIDQLELGEMQIAKPEYCDIFQIALPFFLIFSMIVKIIFNFLTVPVDLSRNADDEENKLVLNKVIYYLLLTLHGIGNLGLLATSIAGLVVAGDHETFMAASAPGLSTKLESGAGINYLISAIVFLGLYCLIYPYSIAMHVSRSSSSSKSSFEMRAL